MTLFDGDLIQLTGIRVRAHHGVYDFERENGQLFVIDVTLALDLFAPASNDELAATVDYSQVAQAVEAAVASDPVDLIETVANRIVHALFGFAPVQAVRVTVHKPDAPMEQAVDDASVTLVRARGDARVKPAAGADA